jgi:hypothetical protein
MSGAEKQFVGQFDGLNDITFTFDVYISISVHVFAISLRVLRTPLYVP